MKHRADPQGFTLIELMIVIAIIGIIAAIAIPAMSSYTEKAKIAQAVSDLDRIYKAMVLLEVDTEEWPGGVSPGSGNEVWDLTTASAGLLANDGSFSNWAGPYIDDIPKDPWGHDYFLDTDYDVDGVDRAVLGSFGPNGVGQNVYDDDDVIKVIN